MNIEMLPEAQADLDDGYWFYENQVAGLGEYFLTSIVSDIRSLQLFAGIHQARLSKISQAIERNRRTYCFDGQWKGGDGVV